MILKWLKYTVLLVCLFCFSFSLLGQKNGEYIGPLQIGDYAGDAIYTYKVVDNDTVLDGPFQLKRSSLEALLEKEDVSFLFKGDFKNGLPTNNWRFQFGEFQSNSQSKVVDYEYRVLISGIQEEGNGLINKGKPDGFWTYQVNQIKNSEKEKALFKSEITFENGVPQRNFQIENEKVILVGRFLRNGLAHDEWTSYEVDAIENTENWLFKEGILQKISINQDGVRKSIPGFKSKAREYQTINLDERYLNVLEITLLSTAEDAQISTSLPSLLNQNKSYYKKIDSILSELGTSDFKTNFKVKVPYFPLDSVENQSIKTISDDYIIAKGISDSLLHNTQLNILKRSDSNALYYYNCVAKIQEDFLNPIEQFVQLNNQKIISFIDRDKFIEKLWFEGKPTTAITVAIDTNQTTKVFELSNAKSFNFQGDDVSMLEQLTSYAKLSLEFVQKALSDKLTQAERFQTLIRLEENLIQQNEALLTQIDSLDENLPAKYSNAIENIKKVADVSLSSYASIENQNEKLSYGEILEECFLSFSGLTNSIIKLPEQEKALDSLYTDSVFNPFMAVVMDEEVKKRIMSAYKKILTPYFLSSISKDLKCESAESLNEEMEKTYERMILLREEDTKKLERKIRREQDPKVVLQLLGVQTKKEDK